MTRKIQKPNSTLISHPIFPCPILNKAPHVVAEAVRHHFSNMRPRFTHKLLFWCKPISSHWHHTQAIGRRKERQKIGNPPVLKPQRLAIDLCQGRPAQEVKQYLYPLPG